MSIYRLNIYAFYGITLAIMVCSFYELYYFMKPENNHTDRSIIIVSIGGAIISLIGLTIAIVLDSMDQQQSMIPTYTFTIDELPKPKPLMAGLNVPEL